MRFQVPQFIETEDKIAGPFGLRQLLYFVAAGIVSFILFYVFALWLWVFVTIIFFGIAFALSQKYNGMPAAKMLVSALNFLIKPRLYLWQREIEQKTVAMPRLNSAPTVSQEKILEQRKNLKEFFSEMPSVKKLWVDLATTKNPIPKREKNFPPQISQKFSVFRKLSGEKEVAKRVDYR